VEQPEEQIRGELIVGMAREQIVGVHMGLTTPKTWLGVGLGQSVVLGRRRLESEACQHRLNAVSISNTSQSGWETLFTNRFLILSPVRQVPRWPPLLQVFIRLSLIA
jgi:hypothetical protein